MRRLCIYVIYDVQKKINPYIVTALSEIKKFVDDIVVVCNFGDKATDTSNIEQYTNEVYFRENIGFDAGAYKDAICHYIGKKKLHEYNELLLTNDTYFAPLYPFDEMFEMMENVECDFWGMTMHPGGYIESIGSFGKHIQSFFLVFRENVLKSRVFFLFWENLECAKTKDYTIRNYEIGINKCLTNSGFVGVSYLEQRGFLYTGPENINPYSSLSLELIKDYRIPMIKKTNFYGSNRWLVNAFKAYDYISRYTDYDTLLIEQYVREYQRKGFFGTYYDFETMEQFVSTHDKIYIYGAGKWGNILSEYFEYRRWSYEDIIVTHSNQLSLTEFRDITVGENDGIVIALAHKKDCDEVKEYIGCACREDQIFTPCYVNNE